MSSGIESWIPVAILGIANIFLGKYLAATLDHPAGSRNKNAGRVLVPAIVLYATGLGLLYILTGFQLTFLQACILSVCFIGSYAFHSGYLRPGGSPEPKDISLNRRVSAVMKVFERHRWDLSSEASVQTLADTNQIHFDGADYEILAGTMGDFEYEMSRPQIQKMPAKEIEYDDACARHIISLADALAGNGDIEGIVSLWGKEHDLSGFDYDGLDRLVRFSGVLRKKRMMDVA
jgi:hypothetical protein